MSAALDEELMTPPTSFEADAILSASGITKNFGGFRALDNVSISIKSGTISGLIGPNGAGKSTLFNTLTGALKADRGSIVLNGEDVSHHSPNQLFAKGVARTFQIPRPFPEMSVLENVMLAPKAQLGEKIWAPFLVPNKIATEEARIRKRAQEILDFVTLRKLADHPAGMISGGQTKLLELARVLMGDPDIILLDEPAAGVNPILNNILIEKIKELNRGGKTFFIIEHNMEFIMRNCDPIIALAEGKVIFEGNEAEAHNNKFLLEAYLGDPA